MTFGNINAWASMCKSVQLGKETCHIYLNKLKVWINWKAPLWSGSTLLIWTDWKQAQFITSASMHIKRVGLILINVEQYIWMGLPNSKTSTFTCNIVSSLDYLFKIRGNFAHFSIRKGPVFWPQIWLRKIPERCIFFNMLYIKKILIIFISCWLFKISFKKRFSGNF